MKSSELRQLALSRRSLLVATGAALAVSRTPRADAASKVLRILCWRGYDNVDAVKAFSAKFGYRVQADYLGANDEVFLKLRAGGLGKYDLVTPSNGVIAALVGDGLIQPLDETRLESNKACLPQFQRPSWSVVNNQFYAAPYVWGTTPMVYASKAIPAPAAWTDILTDKFVDKVVMTNDSVSNIMIWNRVLGAADPAIVSLDQLAATKAVLMRIKREFAQTYTADMSVVANRLATGKALVSTTGWESVPVMPGYSGAGLQIARPNPGDFSFCDNLCLAAGSPNPDAAYAFIDYMRAAGAQVILMNAMKRATVNAAAVPKLDFYSRSVYDYDHLDEFLVKSPFYGFPPFDSDTEGIATYVDWINAWEDITNAKLNSLQPPKATTVPGATGTSPATK